MHDKYRTLMQVYPREFIFARSRRCAKPAPDEQLNFLMQFTLVSLSFLRKGATRPVGKYGNAMNLAGRLISATVPKDSNVYIYCRLIHLISHN